MKITWSFYPKGQPSVTLTVVLEPIVPNEHNGFFVENDNIAIVNHHIFKVFDTGSTEEKKKCFERLVRIKHNPTKLLWT